MNTNAAQLKKDRPVAYRVNNSWKFDLLLNDSPYNLKYAQLACPLHWASNGDMSTNSLFETPVTRFINEGGDASKRG